ncbi:GGDEF domain-containing protein [Vibrio maerlii]|uniref:GGDEF domain-containing protein n=1 Tax=Vibrio maerlii TaxID=2231648 RepID=UPI000E3E8D59|nr:GGDEF domain-containing protein [Vibrio maerlii]
MNQQQSLLSAYQQINQLFTDLSLGMDSEELNQRVIDLAKQWFNDATVLIRRSTQSLSTLKQSLSSYELARQSYMQQLSAPLTSSQGRHFGELVVNKVGSESSDDAQRLQMLAAFYTTALEKLALDEEVRYQAEHDPLTNCLNRKALLTKSKAKLHSGARYVAAFFGDVDKFKQVNDQHGHDVGDAVLCQVGDVFNRTFKGVGVNGRLGGDEFVGIYYSDSYEDILEFKALLTAQLKNQPLLSKLGIGLSVGMSISVAQELNSIESLIKRADQDMYKLKLDSKQSSEPNEQEKGPRLDYTLMFSSVSDYSWS